MCNTVFYSTIYFIAIILLFFFVFLADREAASSSNLLDTTINLSGDQQPQPSGQAAESEIIEAT